MSDSLQPHKLQNARFSCPLSSPGTCSNSCTLRQWCHPTISSSVAPFSSCPQSFSALGSFPMSQLFASGGQSIGASASASVLPMNIQGWFPLGRTDLLAVQGTLKSLLQHHNLKALIPRSCGNQEHPGNFPKLPPGGSTGPFEKNQYTRLVVYWNLELGLSVSW